MGSIRDDHHAEYRPLYELLGDLVSEAKDAGFLEQGNDLGLARRALNNQAYHAAATPVYYRKPEHRTELGAAGLEEGTSMADMFRFVGEVLARTRFLRAPQEGSHLVEQYDKAAGLIEHLASQMPNGDAVSLRRPLPPPEVIDAEVLADEAAGRTARRRLQMSSEDRKAIEERAVLVATEAFEQLGYRVEDVGAHESYDLDVCRTGERIWVEVKGTTTFGEAIILTRNEVDLHRTKFPDNALAVVRQIVLDRSMVPPAASGGELVLVRPWRVDDEALTALTYKYETGLGD